VLAHPGSAVVGVNPSHDFAVMTWSLAWWPWAIEHAHLSLHTGALWAPSGFPTLWMTSIPGPALLAAPLTLTFGPLVAYNVMMLAALLSAAVSAFLLCRELTGRFVPSLVGGGVFGFSPYMLGHTLSQHLNLTFVCPIPLLALLVVRHAGGKMRDWPFVLGFAGLLLLEFLTSLELFAVLVVLAAVTLCLTPLLAGSHRGALLRTARWALVGAAVCVPIVVPLILAALASSHAALPYAPSGFATDAVNLVVPTPTVLAGSVHSLRHLTADFAGNIGEQDGYLGIPLLAVAIAAGIAERRRGGGLGVALLVVAVVLSLGPLLTVGGRPIARIPVALSHVPALADVLPDRIAVFASLVAACLCAVWLARPGHRAIRIAVGIVVVASLLPNPWPASRLAGSWNGVSTAFGWSSERLPAGVAADWQGVFAAGTRVLVLPGSGSTAAESWLAQSGMRFSLVDAYTPFVPSGVGWSPLLASLQQRQPPLLGAARLRAFLWARHVGAVAILRRDRGAWRRDVALATGTRPRVLAGVLVYAVDRHAPPLPADARRTRPRDRRVWLRFVNGRARVVARAGREARPVTLSAPGADADQPALAVGSGGRAVVAFDEATAGRAHLRVAVLAHGRWLTTTLAPVRQPIARPTVVLTRSGRAVVAWIAQRGPDGVVLVSSRSALGDWSRPTTLAEAVGIGAVDLAAGRGGQVEAAWQQVLANEWSLHAATLAGGSWTTRVLESAVTPFTTATVRASTRCAQQWKPAPWSPGPVICGRFAPPPGA
jgi:hypothetical protein